MSTLILWSAFVALVLLLLAFDLGVLSRGPSKAISAREALARTAGYFCLALCFTVFVYFAYENHWLGLGTSAGPLRQLESDLPFAEQPEPGAVETLNAEAVAHAARGDRHAEYLPKNGSDAATMFLSGYLMEQSLSMDNIFVIALILSYFQVPAAYQHRVLFWGILGALVMRGVMIALGAAIIHSFDWVIYVFGAILIYTALKMLASGDDELDFEQSRLLKLLRRFFAVHPGFDGDKFFTLYEGRTAITPLFIALVIVEGTDLLFAIDSIPAVFGITHDPFLVFTSNVFAILGLRSLYFALVDLLDRFHYLKYSLVAILAFIGAKMLVHTWIDVSSQVSLIVIAASIGLGVGFSFLFPPEAAADPEAASEAESSANEPS